jgi:hypothetical protein
VRGRKVKAPTTIREVGLNIGPLLSWTPFRKMFESVISAPVGLLGVRGKSCFSLYITSSPSPSSSSYIHAFVLSSPQSISEAIHWSHVMYIFKWMEGL